MKKNLVFTFLFIQLVSIAKELKYIVSEIPAELTKNAKAVIRTYDQTLEIHSKESYTLTTKKAITIMNNNGMDLSSFAKGYDKLSSVSNVRATLYNQYGEVVERFGNGDIKDVPNFSCSELYDDNRIKIINIDYREYPFTVEYQFEYKQKGFLDLPDFHPIPDFNVSIEKSSFKIIKPQNYLLRNLPMNTTIQPKISIDKENMIQVWEMNNITAMKHEVLTKSFRDLIPVVNFAPSDFSLANYDGNMESWQNFGKWNWGLLLGRNVLPEETKVKIREMVKNETTDIGKAKILYKYLQDKTRYISIQVGIGGWQPFEASFVDKKSYGDCKALSNYMKSLLDVVGVKSHYTVIHAGTYDDAQVPLEFPSNIFNHIILCIPNKGDTVWLECTSQTMPFGFIGKFTDDRNALLISEEGGKLVHTKVYNINENMANKKTKITIDENLVCKASVDLKYVGLEYDDESKYLSMKPEIQKKNILESIVEPHMVLDGFQIKENRENLPYLVKHYDLSSYKFGNQLNDRIIIPTNFFNKSFSTSSFGENRKNNIFIRRSALYSDTIAIDIHPSLQLDSINTTVEKKSPFGSLNYSIKSGGSKATIIRSFTLLKGEYSVSKWQDFVQYCNDITKAESLKLVMRKQHLSKK